MIEIIVLLLIVMALVRKPRSHAEALYFADVRREERRRWLALVLAAAFIFCVVIFIRAIQPLFS